MAADTKEENQESNKDFIIVTMNQDISPYTAGDVVGLTPEQLEQVDKTAKRRGIEKPYTKGDNRLDRSKIETPTGDSEAELERAREEGEGDPAPNEGIDGKTHEAAQAALDEANAQAKTILEDAEAEAAEVRRQAESDAQSIREQAETDAKKTRDAANSGSGSDKKDDQGGKKK